MPSILRDKGVSESNYSRWAFEILGWLYGERGAPRAWRATLLKFLLGLKNYTFLQSTYDSDVLFTTGLTSVVIIILFVDDLWIFSQRSSDAHELLKLIRQRFKCTEPDWLCACGCRF